MARTRSQSGSKAKGQKFVDSERRDDTTSVTTPLVWESPDNDCVTLKGTLNYEYSDASGPHNRDQTIRLQYDEGVVPVKLSNNGEEYEYILDSASCMHLKDEDGSISAFKNKLVDEIFTRQYFPVEGIVGYSMRNTENSVYAVTFDGGPNTDKNGFNITATATEEHPFTSTDIPPSAMRVSYDLLRMSLMGDRDTIVPLSASVHYCVDTGHMDRLFGEVVSATDVNNHYFRHLTSGSEGYHDDLLAKTLGDGRFFTTESTIGGMAYTLVESQNQGEETPVSSLLVVAIERPLNLFGLTVNDIASGITVVSGETESVVRYEDLFTSSYYAQSSIDSVVGEGDEAKNTSNREMFFAAIEALNRNDYTGMIAKCVRVEQDGATAAFRHNPIDFFNITKYPYVTLTNYSITIDKFQNFSVDFVYPSDYNYTVVRNNFETFHRGWFEHAPGTELTLIQNAFYFNGTDEPFNFNPLYGEGIRVEKSVEDFNDDGQGMVIGINPEDGTTDYASTDERYPTDHRIMIRLNADAQRMYADAYPKSFTYNVERLPYGCVVTLESNTGDDDALFYIPGRYTVSGGLSATTTEQSGASAASAISLLGDVTTTVYGMGLETSSNLYVSGADGKFSPLESETRVMFIVSGGGGNYELSLDTLGTDYLNESVSAQTQFSFSPGSAVIVRPITEYKLVAGDPDPGIVIYNDYGKDDTERIILENRHFFVGNLYLSADGEEAIPVSGENKMYLELAPTHGEPATCAVYSSVPNLTVAGRTVQLIKRDDFFDHEEEEEPEEGDASQLSVDEPIIEISAYPFGDHPSQNVMAVSTNCSSVSARYVISVGGNDFVFECELPEAGMIPTIKIPHYTTGFSIDGASLSVTSEWKDGSRDFGAYSRLSLSAGPDIVNAPYFEKLNLSLQKNIACISAHPISQGIAVWDFLCYKGSMGDTIHLDFDNIMEYEVSAGDKMPRSHVLSAMVYMGWAAGEREDEPTSDGMKEITIPDIVLASGAIFHTNSEYSNINDLTNPVVYGDMSSEGNLFASAVYDWVGEDGKHTQTKSRCDRCEFVDRTIELGRSGIVHGVFSANRETPDNMFIVYGVGTAWNVPEVDYIKDEITLCAYPEFTFDHAKREWYKNGYEYRNGGKSIYTGENGPWNFGTYRISDGRHSESFFYRAVLPPKFNNAAYKGTKVELEYTTSSNSSAVPEQTEYVGAQLGSCLTAIQYVDVPPRYLGMNEPVHKKATVMFDILRNNGEYVFENVSPVYYDSNGSAIKRNFELTTDYYPSGEEYDTDHRYRYGPSFIPAQSYAQKESETGKVAIYYPVDGLVGDTVYDKRYVVDDDGNYVELSGKGLSASMVFPGNIVGVSHGGMSVLPPLSIKGTETVEAYLSAVASGNEASASFDNPGSILWTYHALTYNTGLICELHPCYEWEEQLGIKRDSYINVMTSAKKSYGVAIRADIIGKNAWNNIPSIQMDWDSFGVSVSGYTSGYLRSLPEVKFVSPVVVVNRNTTGYIPWYNESDTAKYDYFTVRGTNTDEITTMPKEETIYRMSGFKDAGYYGIEAKGFVTVEEEDPAGATYALDDGKERTVIRRKQVFEPYASNDDVYVETYESWSSAVLRTPLSDDITLDYTMTDLAIGPNELMTNDVINRRFEMLQHDLEQVKAISKYYHNPPTKFVGYVGYGSEAYASADYSMDTYVSLRDHFGFWNSGDTSMDNRLDWQWCRSSSGEFVCPSAMNLASATIVSGATSMDIDDSTMNIYATIGSKFKLGGMSSYTQVYETSGHVVKDRDYAEVNATEPRIQSIKVMDNGRVFVLAPDFNRVLCYSRFNDMDSRNPYDLVFMYDFGGLGGGDSNLRFNNPIALAIDNGLHENLGQLVYVLDEGNQCVKAFNSYGAFVSMIPYELKKYAKENAISLAVGVDGTVCVLTNHRILYYTLEGKKKGEYKLERTDPIQLCNNKNSNFLYVVYDDDIVKVSTSGLFVGNFSVSQVWHKIGGWRVNEIPPFYGKIRFMAVTKYDQIYLALDNIVLIYADLLREMALAGNTYDKYSWSLDDIKIGKNEYMQDFVVNAALHRMYDNIDLFKRSIYARIRVREKNGIKYIKTDNVMASEYAYLQDMPTKGDVFIPSNAPMSARVFNDNIKLLYDMIVKLLNWCQV